MDKSKIDYTLYLCTDRGLMSCETIEQSVEEGVKGGCTVIQLREKDCTSREGGVLADLSPTMLKLMGLEQPKEMTGKSIIKD